MTEHDIDTILKRLHETDVPPPEEDVKARTLALACAEFEQAHQESSTQPRLIDKPSNSLRAAINKLWSLLMKSTTNRTPYHAFGTVAVAFFALSLVVTLPDLRQSSALDEGFPQTVAPAHNATTTADANATSPDNERSDFPNTAATAPFAYTEIEITAASKEKDFIAKASKPDLEEAIAAAKLEPLASPSEVKSQSERLAAQTSTHPLADASITAAPPSRTGGRVIGETDLQTQTQAGAKREQANVENANDHEQSRMRKSAPALFAPDQDKQPRPPRADSHEEYAAYTANRITQVSENPISTFSIDVDTASYALIRNQLKSGHLPNPQAVRAEELINYFDYDYPLPRSRKQPFESSISVLPSPWHESRKLVHIGIRGYDIPRSRQPDSNLVFLLDVSGSMRAANKLPLVKQSIALLLDVLKPSDTVSIVVYAGAAGTVLAPTPVRQRTEIMAALQRLSAGGSTAGGAGIKLAYQLAEQNFDKDAVNRIVLATDGDFNVGQQSNQELRALVERKRASGVYLSVLGFGRNNYQDDMMQTLAQNGNGIAAYIDTLSEAKKVLVDEATSTLFPIAQDVKLQLEFNPDVVADYRLVGYETRHLNREDFNNDKVDAGDIGTGHTVTAIYEVTPRAAAKTSVDQPRYSGNRKATHTNSSNNEYGWLKIRYKLPKETRSRLIETPILAATQRENSEASFSVAVAGFAQLLANSPYTGDVNYDDIIAMARAHKGEDTFGYRAEFIHLVQMAKIARP